MSADLSRALTRLEDATGWEGIVHDPTVPPELRIQLSIGISLKRIADAMEAREEREASHG